MILVSKSVLYLGEMNMTRQEFKDGSVLCTGDDMIKALEAMWNRQGGYDRDCSFCIHENCEGEKYDENCEPCTIRNTDYSCSCHINPPCSKCVGSNFEVTPYLIDYKHIASGSGNRRWESFKGNEETYNKLMRIMGMGLLVTAETLSTGVIAMYIEGIEDGVRLDLEIDLCEKPEFKEAMRKMIMGFDLNTPTAVAVTIMKPPEQK